MNEEVVSEEVEMTDEESLEASKQLFAPETAPEPEPEVTEEEVTEEEEEGSVEEALGWTKEDKRTLGRVPSLQSKTDATATRVEKMDTTLQDLVRTLQNGFNPTKPLDTEELTQRLTGDDGPEFLKKIAQEANSDLREELKMLKAQQEAIVQNQNAYTAQTEYQDELMELAGNNWGSMEPTYNKILEAVALGVEQENPEAIKKQNRIQNNPEYLHSLAVKIASSGTRAKAQAHEASKDSEADVVRNVSSPGPVVPPSENISDEEASLHIMKYLTNQ